MRLRITFQKNDEIIFASALDLQKIWERSLRRAKIKVKYSEGFHPQPKIQLAVPSPVGFHGSNELIDIWFNNEIVKNDVLEKLNENLPAGLDLVSIEEIPENQKALNGLAESAEYIVTLLDGNFDFLALQESLNSLLDKKVIERERNKKRYDLRPLIIGLNLFKAETSNLQIQMHLLARSGASGRPDEVIKELGIDPALCKFERTLIHFNE
jgi:radical SAM-linked protein